MPKQKVGKGYDKSKLPPPFKQEEFRDSGPIIVFGTQRIGAIYALRNQFNPQRVKLATAGADCVRGISSGTITVVRVPKEIWKPPTFPCERRVAETEAALKALKETGQITVTDVFLA